MLPWLQECPYLQLILPRTLHTQVIVSIRGKYVYCICIPLTKTQKISFSRCLIGGLAPGLRVTYQHVTLLFYVLNSPEMFSLRWKRLHNIPTPRLSLNDPGYAAQWTESDPLQRSRRTCGETVGGSFTTRVLYFKILTHVHPTLSSRTGSSGGSDYAVQLCNFEKYRLCHLIGSDCLEKHLYFTYLFIF